jgi:hypothetical protein
MVVQNNKQNLNKFWLNFFEKDMILYQYHFFDNDIRYDIISNFWPRYRYDIISSKKKIFPVSDDISPYYIDNLVIGYFSLSQ